MVYTSSKSSSEKKFLVVYTYFIIQMWDVSGGAQIGYNLNRIEMISGVYKRDICIVLSIQLRFITLEIIL